MAEGLEHALFYDSNNGDRKYSAVCFEHWLKKFFRTGVFNGDLKVIANSTMNVTVSPGYCNVDGKVRFFAEETVLSIGTAGATQDRIDSIVIERNDIAREITLKVVRGDYADKPVAKSLVRGGGIYQLAIAQIRVNAGAVKITQVNIKDTRMSLELCGLVAGTVSEMDFSQLKAQFDAFYKECEETFDAWFTEKKSVSEDEFDTWFDEIKDQLSTDAAGNLQNQILVERERINNLARMEDGSIVTDAEKEIADVRVDANGITHPTAGDAVREQFNKVREQFDEAEKQFDEVHDIRLGADGVVYPTAGEAVREQFLTMGEYMKNITREYEFIPVNLESIREDHMDTAFTMNSNAVLGESKFEEVISFEGHEGHCVFAEMVKKGDSLMLTNAHSLSSYYPFLAVFDSNRILVAKENFDDLAHSGFKNKEYTFEQDGYFYICFNYTTAQTGEFFYVKHSSRTEPFVLDATANYEDDAEMGEATLKAIMEGRNVVVRVPNVSGDNYVATYSPIYMYQLPNRMNDYLYLFYLKDEKQEIDLTALGMGKIEMPIYGQIKLKLARDYNQTPLM